MWSYLSVLVINQAATQMLQSNWLTHYKRLAIRSISARCFDLSEKMATFSRLSVFSEVLKERLETNGQSNSRKDGYLKDIQAPKFTMQGRNTLEISLP